MKKKYDLSKIENELTGASAFFKRSATPRLVTPPNKPVAAPSKTKPAKAAPVAQEPVTEPPSNVAPPLRHEPTASTRTTERASVRPNGRTPARTVSRYSFEFYMDQIEELKHRSLQDRIQGGSGNMSQMVRLAIDEYLRNHPREDA